MGIYVVLEEEAGVQLEGVADEENPASSSTPNSR